MHDPGPRPWRPSRRGFLGLLSLVLLALGPAAGLARAAQAGAAEGERPHLLHLVVLHTNDVHGQALPRTVGREGERTVGGLARLAARVRAIRAEHQGPGRGVLLLDGGDWYQGTPEGQADGGRRFVRALAALGYDALAIGNHEWDLGEENLLAILEATGVPAVCANVRLSEGGERHPRFAPWRVLEVAGLRVAVVGLVTPSTPTITHPDARRYHFVDPSEELGAVLAELPPGIDLVLPLTHVGHGPERQIAEAFADLPLIVGGHSHTFVREEIDIHGTRVVQAGAKAEVLGRVDLWIDPQTRRPVRIRSQLLELDEEPAEEFRDAGLEALLEDLVRATEAEMSKVVGRLSESPRAGGSLRSSGLGNWITDAMRRATRAEVAVHNKGGIRSSLRAGPITRRDVFEVLPFDNTTVVFELTGAELEAVVRRSFEGRGRRGFEFSGMLVTLEDGPEGALVARIEVGGEPLDRDRAYRLATNSFLAQGGDRLFELGRELELDDTRLPMRALLENELRAAGELAPPQDERVLRAGR